MMVPAPFAVNPLHPCGVCPDTGQAHFPGIKCSEIRAEYADEVTLARIRRRVNRARIYAARAQAAEFARSHDLDGKLGHNFTERLDLESASRSARLLYVELYVYANRNLLDGRIPRSRLRRLTDVEEPDIELSELIAAGVVVEDGGDLVVDWSDQEAREEVEKRRAARAETQKLYRVRKAAHTEGDHSLCDPRHCQAGSVTGNATSHKTGNKTPPRPVPSRPPSGDRDDGQAGSGGASPAARPVEMSTVPIVPRCYKCGQKRGEHLPACRDAVAS